ISITGGQEDLVRCAVAVEGNGTVWAAYTANRKGNFDVYVRPISADGKPGTEQAVTTAAGPDLGPVLATDQFGNVWLACQSWNETREPFTAAGQARIELFERKAGRWQQAGPVTPPGVPGNAWSPALATGPDGEVAVAYDAYRQGDYDI